MELNVTSIVCYNGYRGPVVGSCAELGDNASQIAWNGAKDVAEHSTPILGTEEKKQEFRDHIKDYGAWTIDEINSWSDVELEALLIQDVQNTMREIPDDSFDYNYPEEIPDTFWEMLTEDKTGRLYPNATEWFFQIGM